MAWIVVAGMYCDLCMSLDTFWRLDILRMDRADSLPQKFPLLFSNSQTPSLQQQDVLNCSDAHRESCSTKVGTQVSDSGSIGQLKVQSTGSVASEASQGSNTIDIPVKVVNPINKRESKMYMLSLPLEKMTTLKCLREHILEQLGKGVVSFSLKFDVGYFSGIHKICFVESDSLKPELKRLHEKGKNLWCDGLSPKSRASPIVCIDSDSDGEPPTKKTKLKEKAPSALESKARRVDLYIGK